MFMSFYLPPCVDIVICSFHLPHLVASFRGTTERMSHDLCSLCFPFVSRGGPTLSSARFSFYCFDFTLPKVVYVFSVVKFFLL